MDKRTKEYKEMVARQAKEKEQEDKASNSSLPEKAVALAELEKEPIRKSPTAPWAEQSPWRRDTLRIKKREGWRPHWVDPRNFERNLEDGWTYAKRSDYGMPHDRIPGEESQMDSRIRRRGMVLMEIPEEKALQRQEFYANLADRAEKSIKLRHKKEARENYTEPYEPK